MTDPTDERLAEIRALAALSPGAFARAIERASPTLLRTSLRALIDVLTSARERAERAEAERDEALRPWFGKMPTEYTVYGSGEFSVCGSGKSIADVRRWQHDALDRLPIVLDRLTSAESRATAAEARVVELEGVVRVFKDYADSGASFSYPLGSLQMLERLFPATALTTEGR